MTSSLTAPQPEQGFAHQNINVMITTTPATEPEEKNAHLAAVAQI